METIQEELESIANALKESSKYNLEIEVVAWALQAMKEDNNLSISEAINIGFNEWVK